MSRAKDASSIRNLHEKGATKAEWNDPAGTTAHVGIRLYGGNKSGCHHLQRDGAFQRGSLDQFHLETDDDLGEIWKIRIWHDNTGSSKNKKPKKRLIIAGAGTDTFIHHLIKM